jgi:hypothetical protein
LIPIDQSSDLEIACRAEEFYYHLRVAASTNKQEWR